MLEASAARSGRVEHLTQDTEVVPIVSMSYGIWFITGGKFGLTMQAEEMLVTPTGGAADDMSHFASSVPLEMAPVRKRLLEQEEEQEESTKRQDVGPSVELLPAEDDGPM